MSWSQRCWDQGFVVSRRLAAATCDPAVPAGSKGRKGFLASLNATDDNLGFKVKPWGLGLMARGPATTRRMRRCSSFDNLLAGARRTTPSSMDWPKPARGLGDAFQSGQLTLRSQGHIAMTVWGMAAGHLPDSDD